MTFREAITMAQAAEAQREEWEEIRPSILTLAHNSEVNREVFSRDLWGRLRWLVLGK